MKLFWTLSICGLIGTVSTELFPSYHYGQEHRTPQKIILRSKRQQCVCVSVFFPMPNMITSSSNFQCSCDPNGRPIGFQQQQELQKELSQMQQSPTQNSQCGCELNPAYTSTTESTTPWTAVSFGTTSSTTATTTSPLSEADPNLPIYDCSCVSTGVGGSGNSGSQPSTGQPQTPATVTTPVPTTTTTPAPTPDPTQPTLGTTLAPLSSTSFPIVVPRCQCVEIIIKFSSERQFQCDCGNGPTIVDGGNNGQDPYVVPGMLPTTTTTLTPSPTTTTTTVETTTTPTTTTTTTTSTPSVTTPVTQGPTTPEPDAVPCVMIQIRTGAQVCACQENYKQCTETACCNVKKYRNLPESPKPSYIGPATATVDLLVDLLQKVRETLV